MFANVRQTTRTVCEDSQDTINHVNRLQDLENAAEAVKGLGAVTIDTAAAFVVRLQKSKAHASAIYERAEMR
jgi:hypothetical protein